MYGTIFNMNVKPGHEDALLRDMPTEQPPGMAAWFLMKPDDEDADLIGVAVFRDKESYIANANRPEQHEAFTRMMEHLVSEPRWTDGEFIIGETG